MKAPVRIDITLVRPSLRGRAVDQDRVKAMASSIKQIGLRTPITVRAAQKFSNGQKINAYEIVAGQHRYQAACRLGWDEIDCIVIEDDDPHAALWEIDENLMRVELAPGERASYTAKRKAIYEELHPETVREATLKRGTDAPFRQLVETGSAERFTIDTATKTGKSERSVQRDALRGERIASEVLDEIRGTNLDKGSYLDSLAKLDQGKQMEKVKKDLLSPPKQNSKKKTKKPKEDKETPVEVAPDEWEMRDTKPGGSTASGEEDLLLAEVQELKEILAGYSYEAQRLVAHWVLESKAA